MKRTSIVLRAPRARSLAALLFVSLASHSQIQHYVDPMLPNKQKPTEQRYSSHVLVDSLFVVLALGNKDDLHQNIKVQCHASV